MSRFERVLSNAGSPELVRREVDQWLASASQNGDSNYEILYFYLGDGKLNPERVSEEQFLGNEDAPPRLTGYYGIEAVDLSRDRRTAELWAAIHRDSSTSMTDFRRQAAREGGDAPYTMEEYRILDGRKNGEIRRLEVEIKRLRDELGIDSLALSKERKEHLITKRKLAEANLSELEALSKWESEHNRCLELEAREAEFAPGVEALLNGVVAKAAPLFETAFPQVKVVDGNFVPNSGSAGSVGSGDATAGANGGASAPAGATGGRPAAEGGPSDHDTLEMLAHLLYVSGGARSFAEAEGTPYWPYPLSSWAYVRSLVRMATGSDPGPEPNWPDEAESSPTGAQAVDDGEPS